MRIILTSNKSIYFFFFWKTNEQLKAKGKTTELKKKTAVKFSIRNELKTSFILCITK